MSTLNFPLLIEKKRDGKELTPEEIAFFIDAVVAGTIQDSQIGALLMAVYLKGMSTTETVELTRAMTYSGEIFSFPSEWTDLLVDKHSTGGIGDKISLILAPALAVFGLKVPMVSGRGLGFTGGTLDKLESIPGFKTKLTQEEMTRCLESVGCFIAGATSALAPADAVLYQQRDITSTVGCLPLIVSSILSKKVAEGTKTLVMDVKVGRGTFLKTEESAKEIAELLVKISDGLGVKTSVVISRMDQPLGLAIGNAVEVAESITCLKGNGPPDVQMLVNTLGGIILASKGIVKSSDEGQKAIEESTKNGTALKKFKDMIVAQGVPEDIADELCYGDIVKALPQPTHRTIISAEKSGFITDIDALILGQVTWKLGAGRNKASDPIDHRVGLELVKQVGQRVSVSEPWVQVAHTGTLSDDTIAQIQSSIAIKEEPLHQSPLVVDIIS